MTDLLTAFIQYAASGPQEFCIAMVVPGLCVMLFGKKIEPQKPTPKRQAKRTKRKTVKKSRKKSKAKPKIRQGETAKWKEWMKPEDYNAESHARINDYHSRRDGRKPETDGWQNVGGRVPL